MRSLFKKKWFRIWVMTVVIAPLLSFIGSYGYFYVLALLYPLAQLFAIGQIKATNLNLIWLLHFPFWFYVFRLGLDTEGIFSAIILNSLLGELLFAIIFKRFGRLIWLVLNSCALSIIYLGWIIMRQGTNDFEEIMIIIFSYALAAIISGIGLEYGFLRERGD